ncbi:MAG TPA: TonB-dependent receptor, partial [Blastocatellia bacterium]
MVAPTLKKLKLICSPGVLSFLVLLLSGGIALGQTTGNATLRGTVKDPQRAVIGKASVTLISEATRDERKTTTTEDGLFQFAAIVPGLYSLKVEAAGFKTEERTGIDISPASTQGVDITLQVGVQSETVTVQAAGEQIEKETGAKENTITAKQIDNLSIISRSALELLRILPGVVAPDADQLESVSFGGGANANTSYNVNGLRGQNNNIQIDGSKMLDIGSNNGTIITANPDMVQEVKVQTSNYAAEHGVAGVNISATTKGGSKGFHGEVYDYIRNYRFQANDRSNSYLGTPKPKSAYQYPGGNIGGPVLIPGTKFNRNRDKLFFFFGLEIQRQKVDPGSFLAVVPTLGQRKGDFSDIATSGGQHLNQPIFCLDSKGSVTTDCGGAAQKFAGKVPRGFPNEGALTNNLAPYIDPIGKVLMNLYPQPNFNDPNNRYNDRASTLQPTNRYQMIGRFDYNISEKTKLYVRLAREH